MPTRIQRRRTAGWRMPFLAVYVGRPSHFGNPFVVGQTTPDTWRQNFAGITVRDRAHAVELLRSYLDWRREQGPDWFNRERIGPDFPWESHIRAALRGKDLVCWCPLDQPCHADVLLEIANTPAPSTEE